MSVGIIVKISINVIHIKLSSIFKAFNFTILNRCCQFDTFQNEIDLTVTFDHSQSIDYDLILIE